MTSATIRVRVQARSRRDEVVAVREGVVVVRVTAPALEGRANEAVRRLIAARVGVRAADVMIVRGHHAREKVVRIDGIEQTAAASALEPG